MPLETYRYIRAKTISCDTIISINNEIHKKDSTIIGSLENEIVLNEDKIKSYEVELKSKEELFIKLDSISTIQDKEMSKMEYKIPFYKRKTTYYALISGFIVALLLK